MTPTQQVIVKHDGILLIRELPDTVKLKETEAEAYSAVWDLMIQIERSFLWHMFLRSGLSCGK